MARRSRLRDLLTRLEEELDEDPPQRQSGNYVNHTPKSYCGELDLLHATCAYAL